MTKDEIFDWMLDHRNLSDSEFSNKLRSLLVVTNELPYNHEESDIIAACGLQNSTIATEERMKVEKYNKISQEVEYLEKNYTKREVSYSAIMLHKELETVKKSMSEILLKVMLDKLS